MRSTCLMCHLKSESITLVQIWAADGAIIIGHTVLDVAPKWRGQIVTQLTKPNGCTDKE